MTNNKIESISIYTINSSSSSDYFVHNFTVEKHGEEFLSDLFRELSDPTEVIKVDCTYSDLGYVLNFIQQKRYIKQIDIKFKLLKETEYFGAFRTKRDKQEIKKAINKKNKFEVL